MGVASDKLLAAVSRILPSTTAIFGYSVVSLQNFQLTEIFALVLRWQLAFRRQLRLHQAFLLQLLTIIIPALIT